jgi:hypothetical protein
MYNLIFLLLVLSTNFAYSCGHHRGEQDIELNSNIITFLSEVNKYQQRILLCLDDAVVEYLDSKPSFDIYDLDEEELPLYNTPTGTPRLKKKKLVQ